MKKRTRVELDKLVAALRVAMPPETETTATIDENAYRLAIERVEDPSYAKFEAIYPALMELGVDWMGRSPNFAPLVNEALQRPIVRLCLERVRLAWLSSMTEPGRIMFEAAGWFGMAVWEALGRKRMTMSLFHSLSLGFVTALQKESDRDRETQRLARLLLHSSGYDEDGVLADEGAADLWTGAFVWAGHGFPRVRIEAKTASLHCFSSVSEEAMRAAELRLPWDAFVVEFPPGILWFDNSEVSDSAVVSSGWATEVMLTWLPNYNEKGGVFTIIINCGGALISGARMDLVDLLISAPVMSTEHVAPGGSITDEDETTMARALRIVSGMLMRLNGGYADPVRLQEQKSKRAVVSKFRPALPSRDFLFAEDVELDLRQEARETAGQRSVDWKSRWLVRGHHRNQFLGEGKATKRTWVRPHWKGPKEAPMRVRDFVEPVDASDR